MMSPLGKIALLNLLNFGHHLGKIPWLCPLYVIIIHTVDLVKY